MATLAAIGRLHLRQINVDRSTISKFTRASLATVLAWMLLWPGQALALENTAGNRIAQAERYLETMDLNAVWRDISSTVLQSVPADKTNAARTILQRVKVERMRAILIDAMVQTYTADELKALADFYGSAVGRSILQKGGRFVEMATPAVENMVREAVEQH